MRISALKLQYILVSFLLIAGILPALAHTAPVDAPVLSGTTAAWLYLKLGFTHILPLGYDHVLFVLGLYFLSPKLKTVLWQATAFTIAHSITLGLAMYHLIEPPAYLIEPIIALSIAFVALENLVTDQLKWWRTAIVFGFGLIHGCGFAGVLSELGMPSNYFITALLTFNVGVELGQITVIAIAYLLVGRWFSKKEWYRKRIVYPISIIIAFTAFYWTIERIFFS
jgi:hypothetical protein